MARQKTRLTEGTRAKTQYLEALRWRRAVERELRTLGITLPQWLVLEATHDLVRETRDAVNQNAVSERSELDRMTISQVMATLEKKGLVDRGPDPTGRGYRILVTRRGRDLLLRGSDCVEAVSKRQASS